VRLSKTRRELGQEGGTANREQKKDMVSGRGSIGSAGEGYPRKDGGCNQRVEEQVSFRKEGRNARGGVMYGLFFRTIEREVDRTTWKVQDTRG